MRAAFSRCFSRTFWIRCGTLLCLAAFLWTGLAAPAAAQADPDSVRAELLREQGLPADHSPDGALWRALAAPGWGQLYNRQYWKMPLVYAGLGGVIALVAHFNSQYRLYQRAGRFRQGQEQNPDDNPFEQYEEQYQTVLEQRGAPDGELDSSLLREQRDNFRRNRDLSILGVGAFYVFTVLDAYVSAHLMAFDVGEDLSIEVHPELDGATMRLNF